MFLPDFDAENTFFCGQTFSWQRIQGGYIASIDRRPVFLESAGEGCYLLHTDGVADGRHAEEAYWRVYFDCERDYAALAGEFSDDPHVTAAMQCFPGIRLLRQPVWETLCSFILSANNNIKRITSIYQRLCKTLGQPKEILGQTVHSFPSAQAIVLAGEDFLRTCGLGYRAPYLYRTAEEVARGYDLHALAEMGYERALKETMRFHGVGEKVADCVLLFSCGYTEAFPVDTWVLRLMRDLYGVTGRAPIIKKESRRLFSKDAGIVQQFLFHAARMGLYAPLLQQQKTCPPS